MGRAFWGIGGGDGGEVAVVGVVEVAVVVDVHACWG